MERNSRTAALNPYGIISLFLFHLIYMLRLNLRLFSHLEIFFHFPFYYLIIHVIIRLTMQFSLCNYINPLLAVPFVSVFGPGYF